MIRSRLSSLMLCPPVCSLSGRHTRRFAATQALTQTAGGHPSAFPVRLPGCAGGIHMARPPAFGHDWDVAELFSLRFSIVSMSPFLPCADSLTTYVWLA